MKIFLVRLRNTNHEFHGPLLRELVSRYYLGSIAPFLWLALVIGISATTSALASTTYYVDGNNSTASDSNPGTQASPWKTIGKASATMVAGDTTTVNAGTYNEEIGTTRSGSSGNRITFRASGTVNTGGWNIIHDYITVDGFTLNGVPMIIGAGGSSTGSYCEILNNKLTDADIAMANRSNATGCLIKGNHVVMTIADGSAGPSITLWGSNNIADSNEIGPSVDTDAFWFWGHDNIIRNNYVHDIKFGSPAQTAHMDLFQTFGDNGDASYNNIIENNRFINSEGQMCMLTNDHVAEIHDLIIRNNIFAHIAIQANLGIPNIQFYNNTFYDVGPFSGYATTGTPGDSTGTVFKNNIFVQINGYNPSDYSGGLFTWTGFPAWTFANNFFSTLSGAALTNFDYTEQVGGINGGAINFANAAANDFSIKSGSAAIDKGTTLSGFNYDYVRTARPQGSAWDIGAYEYVTGSTTALLPPTNLRVQ